MGNTVVVVEHDEEIIRAADYIIDLGPEGGSGGGTIVATGTPEEVAQNPHSFTGQYLRPVLERAAELQSQKKHKRRSSGRAVCCCSVPFCQTLGFASQGVLWYNTLI